MFCRTFRIRKGQIRECTNILTIIEELRSELDHLGTVYRLTDPEILKVSRRLDMLINLFMHSSFKDAKALHDSCVMSSLKEVN